MKKIKFNRKVYCEDPNTASIKKYSGLDIIAANLESANGSNEQTIIIRPVNSKGEGPGFFIEILAKDITELLKILNKFNPDPVLVDDKDLQFLTWIERAACPNCKKIGSLEATSYSRAKCSYCNRVTDLIEWKVIR